ncbi:MAG: hypothetical protein ACTII7_08130 [Galactobacter sp.]
MISLLSTFPLPAATFADPSWMERVLAPLAVVELEDGTSLPVAIPFEPAGGRLGERTRDVHTAFAAPDRMGFRLLPNGTLDFLGDPAYFELIHRAQNHRQSRGLTAFYEDQYAGFDSARPRGVVPQTCIEEFDPDLAWLDDDTVEEFMPNATPFTRVLTVDPSGVLPRSVGLFSIWWEPASSTVLVTRGD